MTHYLLDTNHAGALLRNDARLVARIAVLTDAELSVCLPSAGELWFMVYNSARPAENAARLVRLFSRFRLVEYGMREAEEFGKIRAELRRQGVQSRRSMSKSRRSRASADSSCSLPMLTFDTSLT